MNDSAKDGSMLSTALKLIEEHCSLALLEYRYERDEFRRRMWVGLVSGMFLVSAFVYLQIALFVGLLRLGIPHYGVCLILMAVFSIAGGVTWRRYGPRDPRVGQPFQSTHDELARSLQWTHQHLS